MRWEKAHRGDVNMLTGEVNPKLKAPVIELPSDTQETNLHGDIEGSPYGANPGSKSLAEAAEESATAAEAPARASRKSS